MAYDGLTLKTCTDELISRLTDAKVQKILMPGREEVVLVLYTQSRENLKLVLSADAGNCGIYISAANKPNPKTAPAFCMLLRKYLSNARITEIRQQGLDRIVIISFEAKDEMLHKTECRLILEIMGKHSNIIVTNQDYKVLDSIRRVSVDVSSKRQVLPGCIYQAPPTSRYNPLTLSQTSLEELILPPRDVSLVHHLTNTFEGMSSQTAAEILYRSRLDETLLLPRHARILVEVLTGLFKEAAEAPKPCIQLNGSGLPVFFSALPYQTYPADSRRMFSTCNEMLDYYYTKRESDFLLNQKKDTLSSFLKKTLTKLNKKIKIYMESLEEAKKAEDLIGRAQLITANIYRLKKGMRQFEANDFATGDPVTISLDLSLTPAQNAQKLFKKSAKLKKSLEINTKQLSAALEEREFLESTAMYVQHAEEPADLEELHYLLQKYGYIKEQQKKKPEPPRESSPREFQSAAGVRILVGKNDRQNDFLTMHIAEKSDIWFHAKNIPGSHVLLLANGVPLDDIDDASILMAASLAAKYSNARLSGKVPVDYTQRINVKKPPASRPGKVIYDHYYTVYVDPGNV